jgi:hypothetical protein
MRVKREQSKSLEMAIQHPTVLLPWLYHGKNIVDTPNHPCFIWNINREAMLRINEVVKLLDRVSRINLSQTESKFSHFPLSLFKKPAIQLRRSSSIKYLHLASETRHEWLKTAKSKLSCKTHHGFVRIIGTTILELRINCRASLSFNYREGRHGLCCSHCIG